MKQAGPSLVSAMEVLPEEPGVPALHWAQTIAPVPGKGFSKTSGCENQ